MKARQLLKHAPEIRDALRTTWQALADEAFYREEYFLMYRKLFLLGKIDACDLSPLHPVTLSGAMRQRANIPKEARYFAFAYPATYTDSIARLAWLGWLCASLPSRIQSSSSPPRDARNPSHV